MKLPIYLDHHATTPLDGRVLDEMMPYLTDRFGNASSTDHLYGHQAAEAVEEARTKVALMVGAKSDEIIFTGGATESNNLALTGIMTKYADRGDHLVTCSTEHKAVLDTARHLEQSGKRVTYLPVDEHGMVDPGAIKEAITDGTVLVSVMAANNEVGTIPDITKIGRIVHDHGVLFHTDAAQAAGHIPLDVREMNIDLMSISAHKMYGPKGVGALYVRGMRPMVGLEPIIHGGGQERNIRSGTHNVPSIVGFGKAAEIASREMCTEQCRLAKLSSGMISGLSEVGAVLNGHPGRRLAHNANLSFSGVDGKAIINSVSEWLAISAGSACTTRAVEPSHVLLAMGLGEERAHSSIRIGLGRSTTTEEADFAVGKISEHVRELSMIAGR